MTAAESTTAEAPRERVRPPRRAGSSTSGGAMLVVVGTETVWTVSGSSWIGNGVISTGTVTKSWLLSSRERP